MKGGWGYISDMGCGPIVAWDFVMSDLRHWGLVFKDVMWFGIFFLFESAW